LKTGWKNPVKGEPAKESTLSVRGDFAEFTNLMRAVIIKKKEKQPIPASASPVPAAQKANP
jgi:hypothetical protein